MASSSGNSSGSIQIQNSGSEEDLQQCLMDQRKRKRMQSNRESARRSRLRKQKHLDDMMAKVTELKNENNQILTTINVTTQQYMNVEAENSVLRAQMMELSQRLQSLNEILNYINSSTAAVAATTAPPPPATNCVFQADEFQGFSDGFLNNPWNLMYINQQPIMAASADMFDY
ncbi:bZIP transcription factor 11-like [Olea europaea subsp. europaea]|uniref:BZIP transcription factor 11-like n=1 Tax=Olea europaea subsp. europaea TaxID=158383 RepID=A0A8S0UQ52_OLEEU|nr:bZIP transcription factor 11-like [Olea europaea subsp. europaea]